MSFQCQRTLLHKIRIGVAVLCTGIYWSAPSTANADLQTVLTLADARHLVSRTGLGTNAAELQYLSGKTRAAAIDYIMDGFATTPQIPMPQWVIDPAPLYWTRQDLTRTERRKFDRRRDAELTGLRQWWVDNMLATVSPQTEKMVLFWHDHFATSYDGVNRQSVAIARQNRTFRELGLGNFRTLLQAMLRDPALLNFLDNLSNRKNAPNENLARELLELFTLGEGNYDEQTVRETARTLTGFGVSQNKNLTFEFQSWNFDPTDKTLFNQSGNFNGDDLIDLLLAQPETSRFIAAKFWQAFVSDRKPTATQLAPLAETFANSGYELAVLYRSVLEHNAFWSTAARATIVKSPVQLLIGTARTLEYPKIHNQQIPSLLARSGQNLFAPPNVAGWSRGSAWITTGRLLNRFAAIEKITLNTTMSSPQMSMHAMANAGTNNLMYLPDIKNIDVEMQLHLAAEEYHGPAHYKVQLLDAQQQPVWNSGELALAGGHETTRFGRVTDIINLPWQVISFPIAKQALQKAESMRVHFLNDDGGEDGDRNLYVRGASIGNTWIDSATGTQQSSCAPQLSLDAGRLYCQGHVSVPISNKEAHTTSLSNIKFTASSVHVNWVRANVEQLDLTLTLQNFIAPDRFYPTYSFHLHSNTQNAPRLEVNTFGCWPDCVDTWPACAWTSDINPARQTLAFPLVPSDENNNLQCHSQALTGTEQIVVASLFQSASRFITKARKSPREFSQLEIDALDQWEALLNKYQHEIDNRFSNGSLIAIDKKTLLPDKPLPPAHKFDPKLVSAGDVERALIQTRTTFAELLLPGLDVQHLPEFAELEYKPVREQLNFIFKHPAFQLY